VNYLKNYTIPFKGLRDGTHIFDFEVDNKFFEQFEHSEIENGKFSVVVKLEKNATFLALDFITKGIIELECDRCLEKFDMKIESEDRIIAKFGEEIFDSRYIGEELQEISHQQSELNVAQNIYEFIHLHLPYKRVHPDNKQGKPTCNPEILKSLGKYITYEEHEPDPRWDKLKGLLKE
jgi:uncharacterized metal-binding protein YceD (DUF177 family)